MDYLAAFRSELEVGTERPERLALLVGNLIDPTLDVDACIRRLDELADQVEQRMPGGAVGRAQANALITILHQEMAFLGNVDNYYAPENSFLHRVLDTHEGLPITLSLLYMAVGRRLNINLQGLGFPGHFMVEYQDKSGSWILDPFHGKVLASEELSYHLSQIFQQPIRISVPLDQYRVSTSVLILRVLNNLRGVYLAKQRLAETLSVLEYMVIVEPQDANLWRDRGLVQYRLNNLLAAESDLRRYFLHKERLYLFTSEAEMPLIGILDGMSEEGRAATAEERAILSILEQIRESIRRLN